jgi:uncharacterized membrane protein
MKADLLERMKNLEDEVKLQDSTLDARTRLLWAEITKLKSIIEELKAAQQRKEQ